MFTPDMAFEAIVKKQIDRLRSPAIKCVDMVMTELTNIIKKCTEKVILQTGIFQHFSGILLSKTARADSSEYNVLFAK